MEEVTKPGRERPPLTPPVGGGLEEPLLLIAGTDLLN
jgi:hypothetical protein